jgi:hypothetical protein
LVGTAGDRVAAVKSGDSATLDIEALLSHIQDRSEWLLSLDRAYQVDEAERKRTPAYRLLARTA